MWSLIQNTARIIQLFDNWRRHKRVTVYYRVNIDRMSIDVWISLLCSTSRNYSCPHCYSVVIVCSSTRSVNTVVSAHLSRHGRYARLWLDVARSPARHRWPWGVAYPVEQCQYDRTGPGRAASLGMCQRSPRPQRVGTRPLLHRPRRYHRQVLPGEFDDSCWTGQNTSRTRVGYGGAVVRCRYVDDVGGLLVNSLGSRLWAYQSEQANSRWGRYTIAVFVVYRTLWFLLSDSISLVSIVDWLSSIGTHAKPLSLLWKYYRRL